MQSLLAPGGFLLLWEITQPQLDFDITCGLLMNPLEDEGRSPGQPFIVEEQWFEALRTQDFVQVAAFPETEAFEHQIIMAVASASPHSAQKLGRKKLTQNQRNSLQRKPDVSSAEKTYLHSTPDLVCQTPI